LSGATRKVSPSRRAGQPEVCGGTGMKRRESRAGRARRNAAPTGPFAGRTHGARRRQNPPMTDLSLARHIATILGRAAVDDDPRATAEWCWALDALAYGDGSRCA